MGYGAPPPEGGSSQFRPSRHEIDFGVIGESFNLIFQNWKVYAIPGAVMMAAMLPINLIQLPQLLSFGGPVAPPSTALIMILVPVTIGVSIISILFNVGITRFTWNKSRGTGASQSDILFGFRDPWGYLALMIIVGFLSAFGIVLCCVGSLFVAGMLMFALPIKVVEGCTASEAISRSFSMLKKDWFLCGVMYFVLYVLSMLGMVACYVGVILTMPILYVAPTLLYSQYVGMNEPMRPESPTNYPRG